MKNSRFPSFVLFVAALLSASCDDGKPKQQNHYPTPFPMAAQDPMRSVDLVFVVDTSLSMTEEQIKLIQNFPLFIQRLEAIHGGMPNLHLGVITPDLGAAPYNIPGCSESGDGGLFKKGADGQCANPAHSFIVDVEPAGCSIEKIQVDSETRCASHDCGQDNCDRDAFSDGNGGFTEPAGLKLVIDEKGCPRCRNYENETLSEVFSCIANVGTGGCGFEQPLEAVMQALTTPSPQNQGFLRNDAYLAVVMLTDEDDCSVENTELFNPEADINSPLGVLTSFRCTEFGIVCDRPWDRANPGVYHDCTSRPDGDPLRLLYPVSRYTGFLSTIKDASRVIVSMAAGPADGTLSVQMSMNQTPELMPTCVSNPAVPAIRLREFVDYFLASPADGDWARTSICEEDFSPALTGVGTRLASLVGTQCLAAVPAGCPDPAAAFGHEPATQLPAGEAVQCAPDCTVTLRVGGSDISVPPCPADYAGGHPAQEDSQLPVERCWHVQYNPNCAVPCPPGSEADGCDPDANPWRYPSRGAQIVVSHRTAPAEFWSVQAVCASYHLTEQDCTDGVDNDVDGLLDTADPDCR